jgi:hypothetical protein
VFRLKSSPADRSAAGLLVAVLWYTNSYTATPHTTRSLFLFQLLPPYWIIEQMCILR